MSEHHIFRKQFKFEAGAITVSLLSRDDGVCETPQVELTFYGNTVYDPNGNRGVTQQISSKGLNTLKAAVAQAKDYESKLISVLYSLGGNS